ncbi:MAG TPA: hypothetical protein GX396_10495 [Tissierellia bacterium]|jgi:predicted ribosome quality control (RQC) complex YloA/Tae2 family protein|nr:hypothetical protein [Tissierellia bacterium]
MQKKNNKLDSSAGMFLTAEELNNMNFLSGRKLDDGRERFSNLNQWTKKAKDIEAEQKSKKEIIAEIKKLEEKIDIVIEMLEKYTSNENQSKMNTETVTSNNTTWKEKLKGIVSK